MNFGAMMQGFMTPATQAMQHGLQGVNIAALLSGGQQGQAPMSADAAVADVLRRAQAKYGTGQQAQPVKQTPQAQHGFQTGADIPEMRRQAALAALGD